jgi:NTP pyrophosphatase (non-canonical NTP hydrolase)
MYTIYHIPGKKIGVTRNINKRVTEQQGYAPDEYEVLFTSDDIDYISTMEIELQKSYGYRVDRQLYKDLHCNKFNQMNVNVTNQTTTFPVPLNKLKGHLMDNIGIQWRTPDDNYVNLTPNLIPWILQNAKVSMYNDNRCYVYNKSLEVFMDNEFNSAAKELLSQPKSVMFDRKKKKSKKIKPFYAENEENVYDLIRTWATDKGIYKSGDSKTQYLKLIEEAGELAEALLKNDETEVIDAIGDMVVVLTNLAKLRGHNIEDCVTSAYSVIKSRQGSMINGTFVKDENSTTTTTTTEFHNFSTNTL